MENLIKEIFVPGEIINFVLVPNLLCLPDPPGSSQNHA